MNLASCFSFFCNWTVGTLVGYEWQMLIKYEMVIVSSLLLPYIGSSLPHSVAEYQKYSPPFSSLMGGPSWQLGYLCSQLESEWVRLERLIPGLPPCFQLLKNQCNLHISPQNIQQFPIYINRFIRRVPFLCSSLLPCCLRAPPPLLHTWFLGCLTSIVTTPPQTRNDMDVTGEVRSLAARGKLAGIVRTTLGS